jgi:hypothetical protein
MDISNTGAASTGVQKLTLRATIKAQTNIAYFIAHVLQERQMRLSGTLSYQSRMNSALHDKLAPHQ